MSSNDHETMSQLHVLNGDSHVDVSSHNHSESIAPDTPLPSPKELAAHPAVIFDQEATKSVKVSTAKRRKVIRNENLGSATGRRTRFGGASTPAQRSTKPTAPKYKTAEDIKNAAKSARQKRLVETFELHDNKVRELFHLTKFVSLVDYDTKTAKKDESEVFSEVSQRFKLLFTFSSSKAHTNYGKKQRMQRQVDECVLQGMQSALKNAPSVLRLSLNLLQSCQHPTLRQSDPSDQLALIPLPMFHLKEADGASYSLRRMGKPQIFIKEKPQITTSSQICQTNST